MFILNEYVKVTHQITTGSTFRKSWGGYIQIQDESRKYSTVLNRPYSLRSVMRHANFIRIWGHEFRTLSITVTARDQDGLKMIINNHH